MMDNRPAARTQREYEQRSKFQQLPYLQSKNQVHAGYRSASWGEDDRRVERALKIILVLIFVVTSIILLEV